jgi:Protein of unknown function (DUF2817)
VISSRTRGPIVPASDEERGEWLRAFRPDYATARARFLAAAASASWTVREYPTDEAGPSGEPLAVDVAGCGDAASGDAVFLLSSGLHGVEGSFGSAVQTLLLDRWRDTSRVPGGVRVVLLHALNPYGFAWGRRVDRQNVDLNRAFRVEGALPPDDGGYAMVDALLNPRRAPGGTDLFTLRLLLMAATRGVGSLRRTIASGQRSFPRGLFYGGSAPPMLQEWLGRVLRSWLTGARRVVHLDLHTGLGRWGEGRLIVDYPIADEDRGWWRETFGAGGLVEPEGLAGAYTAQGSLGQWCTGRSFAPRYRFAFAEFGTYGGRAVLDGLRAENQAHHWAAAGDRRLAVARGRLRELFCPADPGWRLRAVGGALVLADQAVRSLAAAW